MAICTRCNASLNFFENINHFVGNSKICFSCQGQVKDTLGRLQQQLMQVSAQNNVTEQFCGYIQRELANNRIPPERTPALLQQLNYFKHLTDIWQGRLPVIFVNAIIETDEKAHLDTTAIYYKPNKQVKYIQGRLIATNKNLYFITPDRNSMKIDWNNIVTVDECLGTTPTRQRAVLMHIQVTKGSGGGFYYVSDPKLTVAIITTAVRLWKRHLVELKANPNTQGIPEHVKAAVFQRDGGRCRQCGYTGPYIEYDHVLPRSKGGQNTMENIQLLCGQCNRKKGNRI
jgi:HNH endonuclease